MATTEQLEEFLAQPRNVIVVGIRKDGRPQPTPNWFSWDGEHFYISTTRKRAKYPVFRRDPRVVLLVDDPVDRRYVSLSGTVEIREDLEPELVHFRRTREKHGVPVPDDAEFLASLNADERVLLVVTPDGPTSTWVTNGFG